MTSKRIGFLLLGIICFMSTGVALADYRFNSGIEQPPVVKAQDLPDLSVYTRTAIDEKLQQQHQQAIKPVVELRRVFKEHELVLFTGSGRAGRWAKLQGGVPQAIFIKEGVVTATDIAKAINNPKYFQWDSVNKIAYARLPIVVEFGASLLLSGSEVGELRLSEEKGSFLISDGGLFVLDTKIVGWRDAEQTPAYFKDDDSFRPFITVWGGGELYMHNAHALALGYHRSKSYGLSISQHGFVWNKRLQRASPKAWILNSVFEDLYYGFYCYEADGLVVIDTVYKNNIIYGIDPHDRSSHLIFARNTVYGTKVKHGIIGSRSVDNSWFIGNISYDNKLSGFVLDRNCINNLVVGNKVYKNHTDGITIYESSNNVLRNNHVYGNKKHGIRVRNSENIQIEDNLVFGNGGFGIFGHTKDLRDNKHRDSIKDPYVQRYSFQLKGGKIHANRSGVISAVGPEYLQVSQIDVQNLPGQALVLEGPLQDHYGDFWKTVIKEKQMAELVRKPVAVESSSRELN